MVIRKSPAEKHLSAAGQGLKNGQHFEVLMSGNNTRPDLSTEVIICPVPKEGLRKLAATNGLLP